MEMLDAKAVLLGVVALTLPQIAAAVRCYFLDNIFVWTDAAFTDDQGVTTGCCEFGYK